MRRIGFRRLLLPVQLVLFGVLCFIAHRERQRQEPCTYYWVSFDTPAFAQQPGETVTFLPPCRAPKAELVATALDLPATLAGAILGAALAAILHRKGDIWSFVVSAPMVALLWYWIGLWIDRRLGYVGLPQGRRSFPRVLAKVAFGCSVFTVFLSAIVLLDSVLLHHYRPDGVVVGSTLAGWSVFLMAVTWSSFRRSRPPLSAEPRAQSPHP
jgi:hypothetical protein